MARGFVVESAYYEGNKTVFAVEASGSIGLCPSCGTASRRVHSRYRRRVTDLPLSRRILQLLVIAAASVGPSAQRTATLDSIVHHLGLVTGGRLRKKDDAASELRCRAWSDAAAVRQLTRSGSSAFIIGPCGAIPDTPSPSGIRNGAGSSRCCRIVNPRLPMPGLLLIPRSRSSPVTVMEDMAKPRQRPCGMRYRSRIVGL